MSDLPPFIVTARLDAESFAWLDALRQAHFPPERNVLRAHLTLFHKLPGDEEASVLQTMREVAAAHAPIALRFDEPMFLGRGVAVRADAPALKTVRATLARAWAPWLNPQDRQGFRPHVTIQNKVPADRARALHARLAEDWTPREGRATALQLWRYLGGPWAHVSDAAFGGRA